MRSPSRIRRARLSGSILIFLASSLMAGCGSGDTPASEAPAGATSGDSLNGSTTTITTTAELIPKACQDAREAFNDWSAADLAAAESAGNAIEHSLNLNMQVGQGLSENVQQLIDELNADIQAATQGAVDSGTRATAFNSLFNSCVPLIANLPQDCSDEIGRYPAVTAARAQIVQAQTALLNASTAVRDALLAGDQGGVDAAVAQVTAATDQLTVSRANWNDVVLPPFNTAIEACNTAIS